MTYIFDHIFKTGGTTLNLSYLSAAFEPSRLFIVRGLLTTNTADLEILAAMPEDKKRRLAVIAGHNTGRLRLYFPNAKFMTLVRNPVDRAISGYLHAKFHADAWDIIGREVNEGGIGLWHFVENDLFANRYADFVSVHNWQAKTLLGPLLNTIDLHDDTALSAALQSQFELVGYTEALDLFIFYLHVTEGFPLLLFNNRLVRKERDQFHPTAQDIEVIEQHNQQDEAVYRHVRQAFERRLSGIWSDSVAELHHRYWEALQRFRAETGDDPHRYALFDTAHSAVL